MANPDSDSPDSASQAPNDAYRPERPVEEEDEEDEMDESAAAPVAGGPVAGAQGEAQQPLAEALVGERPDPGARRPDQGQRED